MAIATSLDDDRSHHISLSPVDCITHPQSSVDLLSQTLPLHTSCPGAHPSTGSASTTAVDVPSYEWRCANEGLARVWLGKVWYSSRDNDTPASIGEQLNVDPKLLVAENKGRLRGLKLGRRLYPYTPLVVPTNYTPIDDGVLVETRPGFTRAQALKQPGDECTPTDDHSASSPISDTALVACRSRYGRIHDPTQSFDPSLVALLPQWATKSPKQARKSIENPTRDTATALTDTKPVARKRAKLEVNLNNRRLRESEPIRSSELPTLGDELSSYDFEYVDACLTVPRSEQKHTQEGVDYITSRPDADFVDAPKDTFCCSTPKDGVNEQQRRELHRRFGLDFSAMARDISTNQACLRQLVGELQRYYYSWPIAAREEEVLEAKNLKKMLISLAHNRPARDNHAEWHFEDEWLVKVEHKRRYYSKVRVTYRGRVWNITPGPLSDAAAQDALLLVPMVYAPDVPKSAFPVFVVDVYLDENKDAILAFKWFYRKHEFAGKARKRASTFHDCEVAVGSTVFTTPVDFVRDVALVGSSPEDLSVATFFCRREYDDTKNVLRPLLVLRPNTPA